jgi:hypothetical protein
LLKRRPAGLNFTRTRAPVQAGVRASGKGGADPVQTASSHVADGRAPPFVGRPVMHQPTWGGGLRAPGELRTRRRALPLRPRGRRMGRGDRLLVL